MKEECGFNPENDNSKLIDILSEKIHPIVLGQVYRTKTQIKMLASRLLRNQISDENDIKKVISFLSSESGSHDYTIHRREAEETLGLNIEKPDEGFYKIIKAIYDDIEEELEFTNRYNPNNYIGSDTNKSYKFKRSLIESVSGGSYYFISEGMLSRTQVQTGPGPGMIQQRINDQKTFEGWRYERG